MSEHTVEKDAPECGKPRRYFPQQTCYLPRGHAGDHEDATHLWDNEASVFPPGQTAESDRLYVINPEALGDPNQTPIVQHSVSGCPAHCDDWLYRAVRNNRRLAGLPPQDCACPTPPAEKGQADA